MIRTASAQALHDMTASGERARKTLLILAAVKAATAGLTRREIEDRTGFRPNQVSGRVRELLDSGRLKEGKMRKCSITGNVVNTVCLPGVEA